jgi:hypothetical protein
MAEIDCATDELNINEFTRKITAIIQLNFKNKNTKKKKKERKRKAKNKWYDGICFTFKREIRKLAIKLQKDPKEKNLP